MKFLTLVRQQSKPVLLSEGVLLVLLTGTIDWLSGYEMSMSLFYGVPIMAVIWFCGAKEGLLIGLLCGITWWWADILAGHVYPRLWLAVWEPAVRFGYFGIIAIGGAAVKDKHDAIRTRQRAYLLCHVGPKLPLKLFRRLMRSLESDKGDDCRTF